MFYKNFRINFRIGRMIRLKIPKWLRSYYKTNCQGAFEPLPLIINKVERSSASSNGRKCPVGKFGKKNSEGVQFLLIWHSNYSAVLSKIHSTDCSFYSALYRPLRRRVTHPEMVNTVKLYLYL